MMTVSRLCAALAPSALCACVIWASPGQSTPQQLFRQLQSRSTSDRAAKELLKMGQSDPRARRYLAAHLPAIIQRGPEAREVWVNAVSIAGDLQLAEASQALAKWITAQWGPGTTGLSQWARLADRPAAKALAQIGDPAIPSVAEVLNHEDANERWEAVLVLFNSHTAAAKTALEEYMPREPDPGLRDFVRRTLTSWTPAPVKASGPKSD